MDPISVVKVEELSTARADDLIQLDEGLYDSAPIKADQEWANALTHGIAAAISLIGGFYLVATAAGVHAGLAVACAVYMLSVFGTFVFSTLSHLILRQPALNMLRAWDQAMIYAMISGTYTPIAFVFAPESVRVPLLLAIWVAAIVGLVGKIGFRHRVNAVATWSYVLLGWLPAVPLVSHVPRPLAWAMLIGGVIYSLGILCLVSDHKARYLHAVWHLLVMSAATCHFCGILLYVVLGR